MKPNNKPYKNENIAISESKNLSLSSVENCYNKACLRQDAERLEDEPRKQPYETSQENDMARIKSSYHDGVDSIFRSNNG